MKRPSLRLKFLTHKKIQLRLATMFLAWFVGLVIAYVFIFFFNFRMLSERTDSMPIHDQLLTKLLLVDQTKDLALYYGLAALFYIALIWTYVIVYSHRLTGPVYKLRKILEDSTSKKTWPDKVKFRKSDAFPDLEVAFNQFLETMQPSDKKK